MGWGHWYTLRELEDATDGFAPQNVIGQGGYGIVYHAVLADQTQIAVKNLLNNRSVLVSCSVQDLDDNDDGDIIIS